MVSHRITLNPTNAYRQNAVRFALHSFHQQSHTHKILAWNVTKYSKYSDWQTDWMHFFFAIVVNNKNSYENTLSRMLEKGVKISWFCDHMGKKCNFCHVLYRNEHQSHISWNTNLNKFSRRLYATRENRVTYHIEIKEKKVTPHIQSCCGFI